MPESKNTSKVPIMVSAIGIILCLVQIWLPAYYPNCDGPCHLANATAIADIWKHGVQSFYSKFYTINYSPDPNWLNEIILALLQHLFSYVVAEKVLLSGYVVLMLTGSIRLVRIVGGGTFYWLPAFFLVIFHNAVPQGFYNFSFSIGLYMHLVALWLLWLQEKRWSYALSFPLLLAFTYFSHPVSFVFGCITCGALWLTHTMAVWKTRAERKHMLSSVFLLAGAVVPFLLMFLAFANRYGGVEEIKIQFMPERFKTIISLKHLVNYSHKEEDTLVITGIALMLLCLYLIYSRIRMKITIHRFDGFLITFIFALVVYFVLPDSMLNGGYFTLRAAIFSTLLLLICCSYVTKHSSGSLVAGLSLFAAFTVLFFIRMPVTMAAADIIKEHMEVRPFIRKGAVVAPFTYDTWGRARNGKVICSRNNIFCHMAQYLSDIHDVLVLDNFEANTGYFPLLWRPELDPFVHLARWPGFQAVPPAADIAAYEEKTGIVVDYVLFMNFDSSFTKFNTSEQLVKEVRQNYHVTYASATGRTILYSRNQ